MNRTVGASDVLARARLAVCGPAPTTLVWVSECADGSGPNPGLAGRLDRRCAGAGRIAVDEDLERTAATGRVRLAGRNAGVGQRHKARLRHREADVGARNVDWVVARGDRPEGRGVRRRDRCVRLRDVAARCLLVLQVDALRLLLRQVSRELPSAGSGTSPRRTVRLRPPPPGRPRE